LKEAVMAKAGRDEEQEDKGKQEQVGKKKPLVKWLIIGAALLVVAGAVAGGAYYYLVILAPSKKAASPPPAQIGTVWPMDPFIINLRDANAERYLKLVIQLEISDPQGVKELDLLKPKLRDNILDLLSAKTYQELMDVAGKQRLREEIAMRLNSFLNTTKVSRVYFTEFVVQ